MEILWQTNAWEDYLFWIKNDSAIFNRINELIKDIERSPYKGIGKPKVLRGDLSGFWSRRITQEHRLVYRVKKKQVYIIQCRFHY